MLKMVWICCPQNPSASQNHAYQPSIMQISHHDHKPSWPSAIMTISHHYHQPSWPSAIMTISQNDHQPYRNSKLGVSIWGGHTHQCKPIQTLLYVAWCWQPLFSSQRMVKMSSLASCCVEWCSNWFALVSTFARSLETECGHGTRSHGRVLGAPHFRKNIFLCF